MVGQGVEMFDYTNSFKDPEAVEEIETVEEVVEDEATDETFVGVVTAKLLNIRKSPDGDQANIVTQVEEGAELLVSSEIGDWYEVCTASGIDGYAMKKFIKI